MKNFSRFFSVIFLLLNFLIPVKASPAIIPVTRVIQNDAASLYSLEPDPVLSSFVPAVYTGNQYSVAGIYIQNVLDLQVVQQPASNPGFVSSEAYTVTQFGMAANYGSIGLLAHNNLAGNLFFNIDTDDTIILVYGDGRLEYYDVTEVREYQALSPYSPYSSFVDLSNPGQTLTFEDLFYDTYGIGGRVVMQTCIAQDGVDSWGRLFIIAEKLETEPINYSSSYGLATSINR
jgi:hypothetical protein